MRRAGAVWTWGCDAAILTVGLSLACAPNPAPPQAAPGAHDNAAAERSAGPQHNPGATTAAPTPGDAAEVGRAAMPPFAPESQGKEPPTLAPVTQQKPSVLVLGDDEPGAARPHLLGSIALLSLDATHLTLMGHRQVSAAGYGASLAHCNQLHCIAALGRAVHASQVLWLRRVPKSGMAWQLHVQRIDSATGRVLGEATREMAGEGSKTWEAMRTALRRALGSAVPLLPAGHLDPKDVRQMIDAAKPQLRACYAELVARRSGKVSVTFRVDGAGRVERVLLDAAAPTNRAAEDCMHSVLATLQFRPPSHGPDIVRLDLEFPAAQPISP